MSDYDKTGGLAGPTALLFVVLLAVGTIFLIRNMNARLKRLPDKFPAAPPPEPEPPGDEKPQV